MEEEIRFIMDCHISGFFTSSEHLSTDIEWTLQKLKPQNIFSCSKGLNCLSPPEPEPFHVLTNFISFFALLASSFT